MRVFVWLAHKNEHLSLNVGNVLERKTGMNNKKLMDSSTDDRPDPFNTLKKKCKIRGRKEERRKRGRAAKHHFIGLTPFLIGKFAPVVLSFLQGKVGKDVAALVAGVLK